MPYVSQSSRTRLDPYLVDLLAEIDTTGDAVYCMTRIMQAAFDYQEGAPDKLSFDDQLAPMIGAVTCTLLELYRRIGSPKEDNAIRRNGDCF